MSGEGTELSQLPIEDYAVIGDARGVALVGRNGRIDWWAAPTLDSPPVLAGIVDPEGGGYFALAPTGDSRTERRYVEGTNVLETTFTTSSGRVRVVDAFNLGVNGTLPWTELVRKVVLEEGEVELAFELRPGDRFSTVSPYVRRQGDAVLVDVGDQHLVLTGTGVGEIEVEPHRARGRWRPGKDPCLITVVATDAEPVFVPPPERVAERLEQTVATWQRLSSRISYSGRYEEAVRRSALALELLFQESSGALAAAATTSLPEQLGGSKNWDYRYCWIRDAGLALEALISLGLHEEVQASVSFLLSAIRRTAPDLHVFYRLDGTVADETEQLGVKGYRDSRPVHSGNSAASQRQLGAFGDLFAVVARYCADGHLLDEQTSRLVFELADRCCDLWRREDAGIWELGQYHHYTISKMQCWAALGHALDLVEAGQVASGHADRWRAEREEIRRFVEERCWSDAQQSYTFYAGTNELDASVLLAGRLGYERGARLAATIEACRRELGQGSHLYRYSGMREEEGVFVACSFWLVDALAHTGREKEAVELMDELVATCNDVGLLSEQQDPPTGGFLGNFPQALSHLALVNSAVLLEQHSGGPGQP